MKRSIFKKIILFLVVFLILISIYFGLYFSLSINLIGNEEIYLNVNNDYFENGYNATLLNMKIDKVKVDSNVDVSKIGDYQVKYKVNFLGLSKEKVRKVHVVDREKAVIELVGDQHMYLKQYESFVEPGYKAVDNVDGDITNNVKISSNIDSTKMGTYEISYTVVDSSGNETVVSRTVDVTGGLLTSSIKDFRLSGYFDNVTMKYQDNQYDYFNQTVFLGDSNTTFLHLYGKYISGQQTWGRNNLNIAQINTSTFTIFDDRQVYSLTNALNKHRPKYLIVSPGINAAMYMRKDVYLTELQNFINNMKNNYSDVKIFFVSIFPITNGTLPLTYQKNINEFNYYLAEMCNKNNVGFINFADEVKGVDGYADSQYFECKSELNCGFHLNEVGKAKYIDYIKHLNLGGM